MRITGTRKGHPDPVHQVPRRGRMQVESSERVRTRRWTWLVLSVAGLLAIGAGATYGTFVYDMQGIRNRVRSESQLVETRHGLLEYHVEGVGPPVLVVHGAGGGYDQGLLIAHAYGGTGFRWIVPSRFGYLRSALPADGSTAAQAEAFADLLDALGIDQVAILAMSGGVPPSLQFAQRYPERTSALVLLSSAPFTPLTAGDQKLPVPIWVYQALFGSDFPYWLLQRVAPRTLDTMFDVTPALRAGLAVEEALMVTNMMEAFEPVTWRLAGLNNEGAAIDPKANYHTDAIRAPALVVHAKDDHLNPFRIGEYTAEQLRGSEFLPLATGGHLLLGHQAEVREKVGIFLQQYMAGAK